MLSKPITICLALTFVLLTGLLSAAGAAALGKMCGGIAGITCNDGLWCELQAGQCGGADISGTCVRIPKFCPRIVMPVCGCNGKTYNNDCERVQAKAQKAHNGPC